MSDSLKPHDAGTAAPKPETAPSFASDGNPGTSASALSDWRQLLQLARMLSRFLSASHKRQLWLVAGWAGALSLFEMLVAAAVIPYVQCVSGACHPLVKSLLPDTEWGSLPTLTAGLFLLVALKLAVEAAFAWRAARFGQQVQRATVQRLTRAYLFLDWTAFRARNRTHYFRRCATTAVDAAYAVQQCVTMISAGLVILFLTSLMIWQNPLVSLSLFAGFALINGLTQLLIGRAQKLAALEREAALQRWSVGMTEAFGSFREIRVYGIEGFFLEHLDRATASLAKANRRIGFYPALPRLILDFAVVGVLLTVVSAWWLLSLPMTDLLPQLIFYAVVARTLLPAMMVLASTRTALRASALSIELVLDEIESARSAYTANVGIVASHSHTSCFKLEEVSFRHSPDQGLVLDQVELELVHPSWVAITGRSGAGKSTLLELLCGVITPAAGRVVHEWNSQKERRESPSVAYVPQHVALLDGSVMENVVFGFDEGDADRVDEALALACLTDVVANLDGGRDAVVGADGTRLSGGERQRLALARAIYRRPDLLLLDEATSGLDDATETRLLAGLRSSRPDMSVIYITHRYSNLRFADRVLRLENGKLHEQVDAG